MKANVYDQGRAPDVPQLNEFGKSASQKTKAPAKARSAKWLVAALLVLSAVPQSLAHDAMVVGDEGADPLRVLLHRLHPVPRPSGRRAGMPG